MEVIPENDNSNIDLSNLINNQNESNQKINESPNQKEYPFRLITKEQDKRDINYINNKEKYERDDIKNKDIFRLDEKKMSSIKSTENIRSDEEKKTIVKSVDNTRLEEERKYTTKKNTIIKNIVNQKQGQNQQKPKNKNHKNPKSNLFFISSS